MQGCLMRSAWLAAGRLLVFAPLLSLALKALSSGVQATACEELVIYFVTSCCLSPAEGVPHDEDLDQSWKGVLHIFWDVCRFSGVFSCGTSSCPAAPGRTHRRSSFDIDCCFERRHKQAIRSAWNLVEREKPLRCPSKQHGELIVQQDAAAGVYLVASCAYLGEGRSIVDASVCDCGYIATPTSARIVAYRATMPTPPYIDHL